MLSEQLPGQSQGRHQRQNSTPTVIDTATFNDFPAKPSTPGSHHRGLSLDQTITPRNAKVLTNQEAGKPSITDIFSPQKNPQSMQEAQQLLPKMARPGQNISNNGSPGESKQIHTPIAPRPEHGVTNEQLTALMTTWNNTNLSSIANHYNINDFDSFELMDSTTPAGYLDGFGNGFDDMSFLNQLNQETQKVQLQQQQPSHGMALQGQAHHDHSQRPQTPKNQIVNNHFPMTPATTPYSGKGGVQHAHSRTAESSPTRKDPQLTIKASNAMQRGGSFQDNFTAMSRTPLSPVPSPPHTAPLKPKVSIDKADFPALDLFNMSKLQMDVPADQGGYGNIDCSPLSRAASSVISSFQSSPDVTNEYLFEDFSIGIHGAAVSSRLSNLTETQSAVNLGVYSSSPERGSPHQRSQSMSDLGDLEECVEDTGITGEEIASFISGPDPENKWTCLYSDCGKKFGRKENIKSHVQTHLGDRQFRCKQCSKCFVRQHDLKRHANIHTNARLYPCPCGKEFARHDALTRHRQRGMCIGAFEGTPKKVVKRGRPKKSRPETEERMEKAAKTRQRVLERMMNGSTYASSSSASSTSSHPSPPELLENVSMGASSPSNSQNDISHAAKMDFLAWTPPTSPGFSASHVMSTQHSQQSHTTQGPSHTTSPVMFPELPMSRQGSGDSSQSLYSAMPELDLSSSSPAASKVIDITGSDTGTGSSFTSHGQNDLFSSDFFDRDFLLSQGLQTENRSETGTDGFFNFADLEDVSFEPKQPSNGALKANNPTLSSAADNNSTMDDADTLFYGI